MIKMDTITVGSDAEVPVALATGQIIPVTGLVGGTKENPRQLDKLAKGFCVQEDGPNLEFNIPPARTANGFYENIVNALSACTKLLPPTMYLQPIAYYKLDKKFFRVVKSLHEMGCEPDYCAWSEDENPRPHNDGETRVAGAHVHVGWEKPTNEDRIALIKCLDLVLGFGYLANDDVNRRKLYGRAGAFRPKKYGVEYRVLGNWWLNESAFTVFNCVMQAAQMVNNNFVFNEKESDAIQHAINYGQTKNTEDRQLLRDCMTRANKWAYY